MKCISNYYLDLEEKIEVNFIFDKCAVITCSSIPGHGVKEDKVNKFGFLRISIEYELKEYETLSDGAIFSRPIYLGLLGILSFLLSHPFDVFGPYSESGVFPDGINGLNISKDKILKIEDEDLTDLLVELICVLEIKKKHEKNLIFSLLDRWRKGLFLEKDTDESLLYNDEATLSYFHVLELLGDVYSKSLKSKSKDLIGSFVNDFNKDILSLNGKSLNSENSAKSKLLSSLLNKDVSVNAKISFFLKKFDLYSYETAFWVKNLIESRNQVAHGRRVHYEKAVFPVQPFFPLSTSSLYPLEFLRVLTAKAICCHLDITAFDKPWKEIEGLLISDISSTKTFLESEIFPSMTSSSEKQKK